MEWKHADLDEGIIRVAQSVDCTDSNTPNLKLLKSKAGLRTIPILPPLMEVLIEASRDTKGRFLICNKDEPLTKRACEWMYHHESIETMTIPDEIVDLDDVRKYISDHYSEFKRLDT